MPFYQVITARCTQIPGATGTGKFFGRSGNSSVWNREFLPPIGLPRKLFAFEFFIVAMTPARALRQPDHDLIGLLLYCSPMPPSRHRQTPTDSGDGPCAP